MIPPSSIHRQTLNDGIGCDGVERFDPCLVIPDAMDLHSMSQRGDARLLRAYHLGDVETVRRLLARGATLGAEFASSKWSILHFSCSMFKGDMVAPFVATGEDVDARTPDQEATPLMIAAFHHDVEAMRTLLSCGANPTMLDARGLSAAAYVMGGILKSQHGGRRLETSRTMEALSVLLGVYPGAVADEGERAMSYFVSPDTAALIDVPLLELLVENGARFPTTTPPAQAPADVAAFFGDDEAARRRRIKMRARHLLRAWAKAVCVRSVVAFWQGEATKTQCAEGGAGRKRDRQEFEQDFAW